jgi:glucose uptake protein GlcU
LAKAWGIYLAFFGVVMVFKKDLRHKMFKLAADENFLYTTGFMSFTIGLITVLVHNVWTTDFRVIVTLMGWAALIKGVMRFVDPESTLRLAKKVENNKTLMQFLLLITVLLGFYLMYAGYFS